MSTTTETPPTVRWVDIELVEEPLHLLRTVDMEDPKFQGLVDSMRRDGFWPSRPIEVTEDRTGASLIYVISSEGLHRLTAARIIGLAQVPVVVLEKALTEQERLERAVVAEATHVQARPCEFGRALRKIAEVDEQGNVLNIAELARKVSQDRAWVAARLNLDKLPDSVAVLVDDGLVSIGNALALVDIQKAGITLDDALIEKAKNESVEAFASEAVKRIEEAKKGPKPRKEPAPRLRKLEDVRAELDRAKADPNSPAGYVEALAWALRQDAVTAAAEGADPPRTGAPEEAPVLRAEVTKLEKALADKNLLMEVDRETITDLRKQIEVLQLELEQKCQELDELKKNRKAKAKK